MGAGLFRDHPLERLRRQPQYLYHRLSGDNGSTWTTINNAVPATSSMYTWTGPTLPANQALIRVTRNGTASSGTSTYPFTVLGQPAVTGTSPCQGYAQLSWECNTFGNQL